MAIFGHTPKGPGAASSVDDDETGMTLRADSPLDDEESEVAVFGQAPARPGAGNSLDGEEWAVTIGEDMQAGLP